MPVDSTLFSRPLCTPIQGQLQHSQVSPMTICEGQCRLLKEVCANAGPKFDVAGLPLVLK